MQCVAPVAVADLSESLKEQIKSHLCHINRYYYVPPKNIESSAGQKNKLDLAALISDEGKDEEQVALEQAKKVEDVEQNNIDVIIDVVRTDWTDPGVNQCDVRNINDADNFETEFIYEHVPVENHSGTKRNLQEVSNQIPESDQIPADQFSQVAEQLMKKSAFIYQTLINTFYNRIDTSNSYITVYSKIITYPTSRIYIKLSPRNIFNKLPMLKPMHAYEDEQAYIRERRRILNQLAGTLSDEIACRISYGSPSFGPLHDITFEPAPEYHSLSGETVSPSIASAKHIMEERGEVIFVSVQQFPCFWIADKEKSQIVSVHSSFVRASKMLLANQNEDLYDAIYMSSVFVDLASYLPTRDKIKSDQNIEFIDSSDLKISSPHPTVIDTNSLIENDKQAKSNSISKMYKQVKLPKDFSIQFGTGILDRYLIVSRAQSDECYDIGYDLKMHGFFAKIGKVKCISNAIIEPGYKFIEQNHAQIILPKAAISFRRISSNFTFGCVNIVPSMEQFSGSIKRGMNGLSVMCGQQGNATIVCKFPGRIFSHMMLKVDQMKGTLAVGFILSTNEIVRVNLTTGMVEMPEKTKLEVNVIEPKGLEPNDQLCLHYIIQPKKMNFVMYVKLLRGEQVKDICMLEVPTVECQSAFWMNCAGDCINIVRARLNVAPQKDIAEIQNAQWDK